MKLVCKRKNFPLMNDPSSVNSKLIIIGIMKVNKECSEIKQRLLDKENHKPYILRIFTYKCI